MASSFDRWEKDPFFSAAEEVQESTDRMESIYRTWIHSKKDTSGMWDSEELRRDLRTALGTAKWQVEEFEKAVGSSYVDRSNEDARVRHREFIIALESQISTVETSLKDSAISEGKPPLPWVRLDEGERDELALFLSGPLASEDKKMCTNHGNGDVTTNLKEVDKESPNCFSRNSYNSSELALLDSKNEKSMHGHRRTASAADVGTWNISISGDIPLQNFSNGKSVMPPRKIPSFSGFLNTMGIESAPKLKWSKNGYKKLKADNHHQEFDDVLLQNPPLTKGINACFEKSKSCLDSSDECYDKQLYGWYGGIQRQLQRSQYQMQYSRPVQVIFSVLLLLCFVVLLALHA